MSFHFRRDRMTKLLALDLAKSRTGWCIWHKGWTAPRFGSVRLGSEYATDGQVYARLHKELSALKVTFGFDVIYHEQAILPANLNGQTNLRALQLAAGLAAHVESFGAATGCRVFAVNVSNWRKSFLSADIVKDAQAVARARRKATGKGSARDKLKSLTIERCRQLGFSPRYPDEADAIGIADYALEFHEQVTVPWRSDEVLRPALGVA